MAEPVNPRLLSVNDAATSMGLSFSMMRVLVTSGEIESVKIGARRLIPAEAIDKYIEGKRAK
jgi:excisionase family DNA binding protein